MPGAASFLEEVFRTRGDLSSQPALAALADVPPLSILRAAPQADAPDRASRFRRWRVVLLCVALPAAGIGGLVLRAGPVAPYADTWIATGIVRALPERPLASFGMGGVPKLGQLITSAPAALAHADATGTVLTIIGALALLLCLVAHIAYAWRDLGDDRRLEASIALALASTAPLLWRSTLEGSSIPWAWTLVLLALVMLRTSASLTVPSLVLAAAALFRPEAVGSAVAIALWCSFGGRRTVEPRIRPLALLGGVSVAAFVAGIVAVDLVWTSRLGASARSYDAYVSTYASATPPFAIGARLALSAILLSIGPATVIGGIIGLAATRLRRLPKQLETSHAPLVAGALGWLAVVLVHRLLGGGGFFDRFFFPLITLCAVGAARLVGLPRRPALSWALAGAVAFSTLVSWVGYGPQVGGAAARGDEARAGAELSALIPPDIALASDVAVRAVAVGTGVRPWGTTYVINDPSLDPCVLRAIVVREHVLPPETLSRATRCGTWRNAGTTRGVMVWLRE